MCGSIENVVRAKRQHCRLPSGAVVNFEALDKAFGAIPRTERGMLSRKTLSALPKQERDKFKTQIQSAMEKPAPLDDSALEFVVFMALGDYATKNNMTVGEVAGAVMSQQSGVGIILARA